MRAILHVAMALGFTATARAEPLAEVALRRLLRPIDRYKRQRRNLSNGCYLTRYLRDRAERPPMRAAEVL